MAVKAFLFVLFVASLYSGGKADDCDTVIECIDKSLKKNGRVHFYDIKVTCLEFDEIHGCVESNNCTEHEAMEKLGEFTKHQVEFMKYVCHDPKFKEEYIAASKGFESVTKEFELCEDELQKSVIQTSRTRAEKDICCSLKNFQVCVTTACKNCPANTKRMLEHIITKVSGDTLEHCKGRVCDDDKPAAGKSSILKYNFLLLIDTVLIMSSLFLC